MSDPDHIKHMYLSLISTWNKFVETLTNFSGGIEVNVKLCRVELESRWKSLKMPLVEVESKLVSECLYNPMSVPSECIELIESLQERVNTVSISRSQLYFCFRDDYLLTNIYILL